MHFDVIYIVCSVSILNIIIPEKIRSEIVVIVKKKRAIHRHIVNSTQLNLHLYPSRTLSLYHPLYCLLWGDSDIELHIKRDRLHYSLSLHPPSMKHPASPKYHCTHRPSRQNYFLSIKKTAIMPRKTIVTILIEKSKALYRTMMTPMMTTCPSW